MMRLTLRTLLAYLDDILDPADAHELGKKIEESEIASGLVHRIRSVTRKLRLGAPKLAGRGMGLDANTVAEYLDNTLPQDRAPDFERVCLESDVHLAEVASCHQILTLVLGEPADVDPKLRERVRTLLDRTDGRPGEEAEGTVEDVIREPVPPPVESPRWKQPVDDVADVPAVRPVKASATTGNSSIRVLPIVGTLVVAFLLALVALVAIGPLDRSHPVLGRFFADKPSTGSTALNDTGVQPAQQETTLPPAGTISEPPAGPAYGTSSPPASPGAAVAGTVDGQEPLATPGAGDTRTDATGPQAADTAPQPPAIPEPAAGTLPPPPETAGPPKPPAESGGEPTEPSPPADIPRAAEPPGKMPPDMSSEAGLGKEPVESTPTPPEPLARYTSELHVLCRFDADTETWVRVATHEALAAGEHLLVLPTYRPQIAFASGLQVVVVGPARFQLLEPEADGTPGIALEFGSLIAISNGKPAARLNLHLGERRSSVELEDLDSTLALEVRRYLAPGTDPTEHEGYWLLNAYATAGRLAWLDAGSEEPVQIDAGQVATMVGTSPATVKPPEHPPEWIDARNTRPIDRAASEQLEPILQLNRPVTVSLLEQVTNRLVEVRTLAIRSLSLFGEFDAFVNAFNAKELRIVWWKDLRDSLWSSAQRDRETAGKIQATFERLRGEDGNKLFRMLWGYSPQQLSGGAAGTLVQALDSPSLDVRVLAFLNLSEITGKTNAYQPEYEPRRQRRAVANWERDLRQGEITYKTPPLEIAGGGDDPP